MSVAALASKLASAPCLCEAPRAPARGPLRGLRAGSGFMRNLGTSRIALRVGRRVSGQRDGRGSFAASCAANHSACRASCPIAQLTGGPAAVSSLFCMCGSCTARAQERGTHVGTRSAQRTRHCYSTGLIPGSCFRLHVSVQVTQPTSLTARADACRVCPRAPHPGPCGCRALSPPSTSTAPCRPTTVRSSPFRGA